MGTHTNSKDVEGKSVANSNNSSLDGGWSLQPPAYCLEDDSASGAEQPNGMAVNANESQQNFGNTADLETYKGKSVEKQGRISSPASDYDLVQSAGVFVRQKPIGSGKKLGRLKYNTPILIRSLNKNGQWAFVIAVNGMSGWVNKSYTASPQPEPNATLYHVKGGGAANADILSHYKKQGYSPEIGFDDKDIYKAIAIANNDRLGASVDMDKYNESKSSTSNWLKDKIDGQGDKRSTYQAISFTKGTNIWLPSLGHVKYLRESGAISTRSDWLNAGIEAGKGVTAFSDGLISGFLGGIWDALTGLWDLGGEIISMLGKVVTGEILGDIQNIYKFFKGLTVEKAKEIVGMLLSEIMKGLGDFAANWNNGNFYDKWQFRGKVVGNIVLEVVLAVFTGGAGNAAKWLGKLGKVAPKLVAVFRRIIKGVDKAVPDRLKRKNKDGEKGEVTPEKQKALLAAKVVTEKHDAADSSIAVLKASLLPIKAKFKPVKRFDVEAKKGQPGHYKVWMIASKLSVDDDYTPALNTDHDALKSKYRDWNEEEADAYYKSMKGRDDIDMTAESPDHKAQRWNDYKNRESADWSYEQWSKQYHVNMSNSTKVKREGFYRAMLKDKGITPKPMDTPHGKRYLDVQKKGTRELYEIKTGKEYLTTKGKLPNIERIKKDKYLVGQGYKVTWILEKGASQNLIDALTEAGIIVKIGAQTIK